MSENHAEIVSAKPSHKKKRSFLYGVFVEKPKIIINGIKDLIIFIIKCELLTPAGKVNLGGTGFLLFGMVIISFSNFFVFLYTLCFGKENIIFENYFKWVIIYTAGCAIPLSICEGIARVIESNKSST